MSSAAVNRFSANAQIQATLAYGEDPSALFDDVRSVAPWVAGGAAITDIGLNVTAAVLRSSASGGSQQDRVRANDRIDVLNGGAVGAYAVATTAALTWLVLELVD